MKIPYYHIDAFTTKPFSGNPASVCILKYWLDDDLLQSIANENHLSVTAFLDRYEDGFQIRWLTAEYELDLCGHGSLASAYVIFNFLEQSWNEANLYYSSGVLKVKKSGEMFSLDFPAKNIETFHSDVLIEGLGARPVEMYQYNKERCLALFNTEDEVMQLKPDMAKLRKLDHRGVIVTAPGKHYDFVSRTFYPRKAASEDAVTGASHCLLVPYWAEKLNKFKLYAYQASIRGGELLTELQDDRVMISGKASLYAQGVIKL